MSRPPPERYQKKTTLAPVAARGKALAASASQKVLPVNPRAGAPVKKLRPMLVAAGPPKSNLPGCHKASPSAWKRGERLTLMNRAVSLRWLIGLHKEKETEWDSDHKWSLHCPFGSGTLAGLVDYRIPKLFQIAVNDAAKSGKQEVDGRHPDPYPSLPLCYADLLAGDHVGFADYFVFAPEGGMLVTEIIETVFRFHAAKYVTQQQAASGTPSDASNPAPKKYVEEELHIPDAFVWLDCFAREFDLSRAPESSNDQSKPPAVERSEAQLLDQWNTVISQSRNGLLVVVGPDTLAAKHSPGRRSVLLQHPRCGFAMWAALKRRTAAAESPLAQSSTAESEAKPSPVTEDALNVDSISLLFHPTVAYQRTFLQQLYTFSMLSFLQVAPVPLSSEVKPTSSPEQGSVQSKPPYNISQEVVESMTCVATDEYLKHETEARTVLHAILSSVPPAVLARADELLRQRMAACTWSALEHVLLVPQLATGMYKSHFTGPVRATQWTCTYPVDIHFQLRLAIDANIIMLARGNKCAALPASNSSSDSGAVAAAAMTLTSTIATDSSNSQGTSSSSSVDRTSSPIRKGLSCDSSLHLLLLAPDELLPHFVEFAESRERVATCMRQSQMFLTPHANRPKQVRDVLEDAVKQLPKVFAQILIQAGGVPDPNANTAPNAAAVSTLAPSLPVNGLPSLDPVSPTDRAVSFGWLHRQLFLWTVQHSQKHYSEIFEGDDADNDRIEPWTQRSSGDIVRTFVLPLTDSDKCSFTALLPPECRDKPTYFVSYCWWGTTLAKLLSDLGRGLRCQQLDVNPPPVANFWLDIFAVNQHPGNEQANDLSHLGDVIQASKNGTCFMYGIDGFPLTRIWCLFELWQTLSRKSSFQLKFWYSQDALQLQLPEFLRIFQSIDLNSANATVPADKERILRNIEESKTRQEDIVARIRSVMQKQVSDLMDSHVPTWEVKPGNPPDPLKLSKANAFLLFMATIECLAVDPSVQLVRPKAATSKESTSASTSASSSTNPPATAAVGSVSSMSDASGLGRVQVNPGSLLKLACWPKVQSDMLSWLKSAVGATNWPHFFKVWVPQMPLLKGAKMPTKGPMIK